MKLIEKKESSKTPELIWGEKYKLLRASGDIDAGETVVLVTTETDYDGELEVHSATDEGWAEPQDLQLITDEPQAVAQDTFVIEMTESELIAIVAALDGNHWEMHYPAHLMLQKIAQGEI